MKRQIKSATGPYGNQINVNIEKMEDLRGYLQLAYDILEEMDDETFQLADGEALMNDLDTAIREVNDSIRFGKTGRM